MLTTDHKVRTVQDLVDLEKSKKLNLSPAFQRNSVWTVNDRRLLVQSLFDGLPLPTIYLYRRVGHGGTPLFDVIDGKQRLETILDGAPQGELTATDLSRMAWLALRTKNDGRAKRYIAEGVERDPDNIHIKRLADRFLHR